MNNVNGTRLIFGEFGSRAGDFIGFESMVQRRWSHVTAIIGNLGFLYNMRTGTIHVRIISSLR